jgi:hypothetical protein
MDSTRRDSRLRLTSSIFSTTPPRPSRKARVDASSSDPAKSKERRPSAGDEAIDEAIRRLAALPPQERALALTKLSLANPIPPRF